MKSFMTKVGEWILAPFTKDLPFFVLMFVLFGVPYLYYRFSAFTYTLYLGMIFYVIAYLLSQLTSLIKPIAKWIKLAFVLYALVYCILDFFCILIYECLLTGDFIKIIAGTNLDEASEFFQTYVPWWIVAAFVVVIIGVPAAYCQILKKWQPLSRNKSLIPMLLLILSIAGLYHNYGLIIYEARRGDRWTFRFDEIVDLRDHPTFPVLEETDSIHPQNFIVILGESFSKNHSSLYGYNRETNPLLKKKKDEGNLILFENVTAPAGSTTKAFKFMLTSYTLEDEQKEKRWYEYTNVIEAFKNVGFHTTWISCQNEKGMFDNLPSGYSKLCDTVIFDERSEKPKYDDFLIDAYSPDTISSPALIFYHMMGQHEQFSFRYPDNYRIFGIENQSVSSQDKEVVLDDYDNATVFNDYVVSTIMDLYKDLNAIILYFPDHGLDVYDTDPVYFGHAKATPESQAHCKQIPFIIYVTNDFKESYSSVVERLINIRDKDFCTDRLIFLLLDIAGYRLQ